MRKFLAKLIPDTCPFERTLHVGKYTLRIPPLCKLNPFYEQLMQFKWRHQ